MADAGFKAESFNPFAEVGEPDRSLLSDGVRPAPRLPIELFSSWEDWIAIAAQSTSSPPDYVAAGLLAAGATAIGAARKVLPDPGRSNWEEYPSLWIVLVGNPSSGKTPALTPFDDALRAIEKAEAGDFDERKRQWETNCFEAGERRKAWEMDAGKALKEGYALPPRPSACDASEEPKPPRLIVKDTTIEALAPRFKANPRGLLLSRDELAAWFGNFNKYGGDGDAAMFLERYTGQRLVVDRQKSGGSFIVDCALLGVLGGVQPDRLRPLIEDRPDDGLLARFQFFWPEPVDLLRADRAADAARLLSALHRLRSLAFAKTALLEEVPMLIPFQASAADYFFEWRQRNRERARSARGHMAGWFGKGDGVVSRLALTLEYLDWADTSDASEPAHVSLEALQCACALYDTYLAPMAERVFGDAVRSQSERHAASLLVALRANVAGAAPVFNARTSRRKWNVPGLKEAPPFNAACDALVDAGWLLPVPTRAGDTRGQPKKDYLVNPLLWTDAP